MEDGMAFFLDDREQFGEGASFSENESGWTFWLNKTDRRECECSENCKFLFHSDAFSVTFYFKCVPNIILF
jgi:hypothetical protein